MPRRYTEGYKYCSYCKVYVKTQELRCRRCKRVLRTRPRKFHLKVVKHVDWEGSAPT